MPRGILASFRYVPVSVIAKHSKFDSRNTSSTAATTAFVSNKLATN